MKQNHIVKYPNQYSTTLEFLALQSEKKHKIATKSQDFLFMQFIQGENQFLKSS